MNYIPDYIDELEAEAIYCLREVSVHFDRVALLFSGKDSIVLVHLALKAFYPAKIPFILLHINTGYNFPEIDIFKENVSKKYDLKIVEASVSEAVESGELTDREDKDRNTMQIPVLLKAIKTNKFDVAIGGGRRDEEKARAKERIFSHRDNYGMWNPEDQRHELWNIFNYFKKEGEHFRVFPLSNWTELDIWNYIKRENIDLPKLYFSHFRDVVFRNGMYIYANRNLIGIDQNKIIRKKVRCRTVGDMLTTGLWESEAVNIDQIIDEISKLEIGERGNRADDKTSASSMEDRKREGYF